MLQCGYDLREPVGAAMADLCTDIAPLTTDQYDIIAESLNVPSLFNDATVKLSESVGIRSHSPVISATPRAAGIVQTPEGTTLWLRV